MKIVVWIPKLNLSKVQKQKWLLQHFGSGAINSDYVIFLER